MTGLKHQRQEVKTIVKELKKSTDLLKFFLLWFVLNCCQFVHYILRAGIEIDGNDFIMFPEMLQVFK